MLDLLRSDPSALRLTIIFSFALAMALGCILAASWGKARQTELRLRQLEIEAALKQDMLNRGMSAAEIKAVLEASLTAAPRKPASERATANRDF